MIFNWNFFKGISTGNNGLFLGNILGHFRGVNVLYKNKLIVFPQLKLWVGGIVKFYTKHVTLFISLN